MREHKINITALLNREDITESGWIGKEKLIQEDLIWEVGPEVLYQITRAQKKKEPDSVKLEDLIRLFTEYYSPKRMTYHNCKDVF